MLKFKQESNLTIGTLIALDKMEQELTLLIKPLFIKENLLILILELHHLEVPSGEYRPAPILLRSGGDASATVLGEVQVLFPVRCGQKGHADAGWPQCLVQHGVVLAGVEPRSGSVPEPEGHSHRKLSLR